MEVTSTTRTIPSADDLPGSAGSTEALAAIPSPRSPSDTLCAAPTPSAAPLADTGTSEGAGEDLEGEITYASIYSLTAATSRSGGLSRGNLALLIRYWTRGKGAARIGWGRGGDFMRCVRLLTKHVPPNQVKGFCARLHKRATGTWPGPGRGH